MEHGRTSVPDYRKHQYSGRRKNIKRVRAQIKRFHGEGVTRTQLFRKRKGNDNEGQKKTTKNKEKKETVTTKNEATTSTGSKSLKTYSRKTPKEMSIEELSKKEDREGFENELNNMYQKQNNRWSQDRILEVMNIIEEYNVAPEMNKARSSAHYYYWTHYEVIEEDGEEVLIQKRREPTDPVVRVIPTEKYFDYLSKIHEDTNHGGRDKIKNALVNKYSIPLSAIRSFLNYCYICKAKRILREESHAIAENERTAETLTHGQITLIDKQNQPDGDSRWILHYQDVGTKFNILRPLPSNTVDVVGLELLKIFLEIGPPDELSYRYVDFCASVVDEVKKLWNDVNIEASASDCDEKSDVEALLFAWMMESKSFNWAFGLSFVQYKMNNTFDPVMEQTPFKSFFGYDVRNDAVHVKPDSMVVDVEYEQEPEPIQKVLIVEN